MRRFAVFTGEAHRLGRVGSSAMYMQTAKEPHGDCSRNNPRRRRAAGSEYLSHFNSSTTNVLPARQSCYADLQWMTSA
jgi:hypothetical protein